MKYDSLKKTSYKTLRVKNLDGGINCLLSPSDIEDNQLSDCKNVWFRDGVLKTRAGTRVDASKYIKPEETDTFYKYEYKLHNAGLNIAGEYMRIATGEICVEDYVYYCNVFLVGENGNFLPAGKISFFRTTSEIFYTPINILFYTGKPQTGGGIFAMATTQNDFYDDQRFYAIYEISEDFKEWNRVYNFYIPTLYINGRGNKYAIPKGNNQVNFNSPKILESPNMLNGRFHAYFTSDGYSNSFRLPFPKLSSESVICRIYYNLVDYVEWLVGAHSTENRQTFFGVEVTMQVDREKGTVYFLSNGKDYPIPLMDIYNENNIKITATKEIEKGKEKIIHSTCACNYKSRIIISGGESGNEVYEADFDNPLYFSQKSSVKVGSADSEVVDIAIKDNRIVVLKQDGIYYLNFRNGNKINDISLLADSDKIFTYDDKFYCNIITDKVGCYGKDFTAVLNDDIVFLGKDRKIYLLKSLDSGGLVAISDNPGEKFEYFKYPDFACGGSNNYIIFRKNKAFTAEIKGRNALWHYFEFPEKYKINGGFWFNNNFWFLCSTTDGNVAYIAQLNAETDEFIDLDSEGNVVKCDLPIESSITTKRFNFSSGFKKQKIESIYLSLASKANIGIYVNQRQIADVNLKMTENELNGREYKSVKLSPYVNGADSVYITLDSKSGMSVADLEIIYREIG